jgi:hypothetical protein
MNPNTNCNWCKKSIYKRPSHFTAHKKHFCDFRCQKNSEKSNNTKQCVKCSHCNVEITRTRRRLRSSKSNNHFCNVICRNRFLINHRWKNKDTVKDHGHLRMRVINRDNNSCANCLYNEDIRMLDIHHIDGNHRNNKMENLLSVCVWCHGKHHRCHDPIKNNLTTPSAILIPVGSSPTTLTTLLL